VLSCVSRSWSRGRMGTWPVAVAVRTGCVGIIHRGRPTSSSDQNASQRAMTSLYRGSLLMGTAPFAMDRSSPAESGTSRALSQLSSAIVLCRPRLGKCQTDGADRNNGTWPASRVCACAVYHATHNLLRGSEHNRARHSNTRDSARDLTAIRGIAEIGWAW
jgi:hypothetical protein